MSLSVRIAELAVAVGGRVVANTSDGVWLPASADHWVGDRADSPLRCWPAADTPPPVVWFTSQPNAPCCDNRPVIETALSGAALAYRVERFIARQLDVTLPGTLLRVSGVGVLLQGESTMGKSETALALLDRGHGLVADDAVRIRSGARDELEGTSPELLHGRLAIGALGVLDARRHFGRHAVLKSSPIELIVSLADASNADSLAGDWQPVGLLGHRVPRLRLAAHRPLALLIEIATRELRLRRQGHDSGQDFMTEQERSLK